MPETFDAYWMPFTANRAFKSRPRLITSAAGLHYITSDGRSILDATSGLYCVNAGHGRPEIVDAIARAAGTLDFAPPFQHAHPAVFDLAGDIAALAPADLNHVMLACSGSEAVDTAIKIAIAYHELRGEGARKRLIGRDRGYHGAALGGTAVGGMINNRRHFTEIVAGVDHLAGTYNRTHQSFSTGEPQWGGHLADDLERLVRLHGAETIAAVIVEPVAGSTGCLPPPAGYLQRLRQLTAQFGILLIFDEVITAFGRLGHAFAADRFGVVPDIITFAKGVTNGAAPLSGVVVRHPIHEVFMAEAGQGIEFFHGFTYSGHPLSVAAARAALAIYRREALFERARDAEPAFASAMHSLRDAQHVVDIRAIGIMAGIDLAPRDGAPGARGFEIIERAFDEYDLYVRVVGDTLVVAPPLTATTDVYGDIANRIRTLLNTLH